MYKRILLAVFVVFLICDFSLAAGQLTVTQKGIAAYEYYGSASIGVFAEIENTGDQPIAYDQGLAELLDQSGNTLASTEHVYCYPIILAPGEKGYAYAILQTDYVLEDDVTDYRMTLTGNAASKETTRLKTAGFYESVEGYSCTYYYLAAEVTNESTDRINDIYCVYALKDVNGQLLYVDMLNAYMLGLPGNNTVFIRTIVPVGLVTYLESQNLTPEAVDAVAFKNPYAN